MTSERIAQSISTVIWDFNGTLIDDLDLVLHAVNRQLTRRSLQPLTLARYRSVFGFPVSEYYRRIGLDVDRESMASLSDEFFDAYGPGLTACDLYPGVRDVLRVFERRGWNQFVLSAMEETMLHGMLEHLGIGRHFGAAYGLAHLEGDSKLSRGRDLVADQRIDPTQALVIGDTHHDADVAAELGMSAALVSTGHQSAERLATAGCPVYASVLDVAEAVCEARPDDVASPSS